MYAVMFLENFLYLKIFEIPLFCVSIELINRQKYSVGTYAPSKIEVCKEFTAFNICP